RILLSGVQHAACGELRPLAVDAALKIDYLFSTVVDEIVTVNLQIRAEQPDLSGCLKRSCRNVDVNLISLNGAELAGYLDVTRFNELVQVVTQPGRCELNVALPVGNNSTGRQGSNTS